jgi:Domain of unknown function (DUF4124)
MSARSLMLALLMLAPAWGFGELFKWVDENGVTHYSDTLPQKYSRNANSQLNKKGQVVKQTDRAPTDAEVKAREEERTRRLELEAKEVTQRQQNEVLLATYASEPEIDLARDRALEPYDGRINAAQDRIKFLQTRLQEVEKELEFHTGKDKDGKPRPPPAPLLKQRDNCRSEVAALDESIKNSEREKQGVVARYADAKQRYRDAKSGGLTQASEKLARPAVDRAPDALVKDCFGRWQDLLVYQNQRRAYVVFAEIHRAHQPQELVLDTRARNPYGEFATVRLTCPLTADGGVDEEGTNAKKALFAANR